MKESRSVSIVAVIPAHLASIRFPRKILFPFYGLPMIEHVRRRALMCQSLTDVYVATCDDEIADAVGAFGGKVIMTSDRHINGTSRVAEAVADIECTHVMLLQGDEPLLLPRHLDSITKALAGDYDGEAWNATGPIEAEEELDRHSFVKCALSADNRIMYCFRRTPCFSSFDIQKLFIRKILGIIAFRKDFLLEITALSPTVIEQAELIEQMRIIENGYLLRAVEVSHSLPSVNEPGEAEIIYDYIKENSEQQLLLDIITKQ